MEKASQGQALPAEDLRRLQLVLLDMLLEIDRICKKCTIQYNLIAGTLLGAVRHSGFIPWDDDLDIAMTRAEYDKFRTACQTELDGRKYFFQDNETDPNYPWGYGRLRRKNSEFVRLGQEHLNMQTGIFLDVFPIDAVPGFPPLRGLHHFCCFVLRKVLYADVGRVTSKNVLLRGWYGLLHCIPAKAAFAGQRALYTACNKKRTRLVRNYSFPTPMGRPFGYKRAWYEELGTLDFEGHCFPVPKDWQGYLEYKFGDYMTLPPPEKRHWHPAARLRLPDDGSENNG